MELLAQQILAGVSTGGIYACMALSLVLIHQATRLLNFAQGEMATFSTFVAWQLMNWGLGYWAAFLTTLALSFVAGVLLERIVLSPLHGASALRRVAVLIALFVSLHGVAGSLWGFEVKPFPTPFGTRPLLGSGLISAHAGGMMAVTALLLVAIHLFFRRTHVGLAMRAAAAHPDAARLAGIDVRGMTALGWGMATAIGAVAGMLIAPILFLEPNMMLGVLLYSFGGAVVGGLASPGGAVVGGFAVGIVENLAGTFVPHIGRELKLTIALALVVLVLAVRSRGALRRRAVAVD
jgi:branched-chain amino acid transport system permease protein